MKLSLKSIILVLALDLGACTKNLTAPVISDLKVTTASHALVKPLPAHELSSRITQSSVEARAEATFNKSEIFQRQFLYGADLQHSTIFEADSKLFDQVYALGHEVIFFRKVGAELQVVVDQTGKYESDVNHPERLINSFPIKSEDQDTITISITQGSPVLRQMFWAANPELIRNSWIRSVQFVPEGNYLLIESSVETLKGEIVEHLESIFPRDTLIKNAPEPLLLTEDEPLSKRFRFLTEAPVFRDLKNGRVAVAAASRFNVQLGQLIKWYVTDNAPADILVDIKNSVEGWNRYFQDMWGMPGMSFEGHLPLGAKLGDPRYNVIVWDNVSDGEAAYESQAVDPISGIQSHSNVYIPQSWLKFGTEYWEKGQLALSGKTEGLKRLIAKRNFMGRPLQVNCILGPDEMIPLSGSASELRDSGREVLKGVIFHEVGHGLGLGHNFKGSLGYDGKGTATTSIMDYNFYFLETSAFTNLNTSAGPLLEYDRQFLAAIYNKGQGLTSAPVLPACDDAEADSLDGGIDPLCTRYDAGANPIQWMRDTRALVEKETATLDRMVSLRAALKKIPASLGLAQTIAGEEDTMKKVEQFLALSVGTVNFYFVEGAQSLRYVTQAQLKDLKVFRDNVLPEAFAAVDMRTAVNDSLNYCLALSDLPPAAREIYLNNNLELMNWVRGTGYFGELSRPEQTKFENKVLKLVEQNDEKITGIDSEATFARLRSRLASGLQRTSTAPFEFSAATGVDYETSSAKLLQIMISEQTINGSPRSAEERLTAVKSLKTFADTEVGTEAIAAATEAVKNELKAAANAKEREITRSLLDALTK